MNRLAFVALCLAGVASAIAAAPTSQPADELVKQLSSDNWGTRQSAEQQLIQMGNAAEPALKAALKDKLDPETRSRVEQALQQIDDNRLTGPSIVTLDYDSAPVKIVLADLSRQAHATIKMQNTGFAPPSLTIHVHQQPFWIAMKELCDKTGLSPQYSDEGERAIMLWPGGNQFLNGVSDCNGPFMVVAQTVSENAELSFAQPQAVNRSLTLQMSVLAEPKLMIIGHTYQPHVEQVVDELGRSMVSGQSPYNMINADNGPIWSMVISLQRPDDKSKKIARLKGTMPAVIETRAETWIVPNIMLVHDLNHDFGKYTFSINEVTRNQRFYQLRVSGIRLSAAPGEAMMGIGQVDLLDAEGRALAHRGMGGGGGGPSRISFMLTFDRMGMDHPVGEPAKLVWKVPVVTKTVNIPFDFSNLPLP